MNYFGYPIINGFRSSTPRGFYDPTKGHTGIDIHAPVGTPISLADEVSVVDVREQAQMGKVLYLRTKGGYVVVFAHLSEILVQKGSTVPAGTLLAKSGNTGSATTGAHLHMEVIADAPEAGNEAMTRTLGLFQGYNINPEPVLKALLSADNPEPERHWSDEAFEWAEKEGIISGSHESKTPLTWGEFVVVLKRFKDKL